jgi:hypothetical protein
MMAPRELFNFQLLKLSLLITLILILFLLYSSFFLSSDLPKTSNIIQTFSLIISSPYLLLEKMMGLDVDWTLTALIIFFFWFSFVYSILIVSHNFRQPHEAENR